jgi:hypothetical protein
VSLINTMLQDLDQRRGRSSGEAIPGDVVRSVQRASPWRLGRNALLLAFAVAVTGVAAAWWLQQRNGAPTSQIVIPASTMPGLATSGPTNVPPLPPAALVGDCTRRRGDASFPRRRYRAVRTGEPAEESSHPAARAARTCRHGATRGQGRLAVHQQDRVTDGCI